MQITRCRNGRVLTLTTYEYDGSYVSMHKIPPTLRSKSNIPLKQNHGCEVVPSTYTTKFLQVLYEGVIKIAKHTCHQVSSSVASHEKSIEPDCTQFHVLHELWTHPKSRTHILGGKQSEAFCENSFFFVACCVLFSLLQEKHVA